MRSSTGVARLRRAERGEPNAHFAGFGDPHIRVDGQGLLPVAASRFRGTIGLTGVTQPVMRSCLFVSVADLSGYAERPAVLVAGGAGRPIARDTSPTPLSASASPDWPPSLRLRATARRSWSAAW